jgi:hypothetical protein
MRRFVLLMVGLSPIMIVTIALAQAAAAQQPEDPIAKAVIYGTAVDQDGQPAKELGLTAHALGVALGAMLPATKTDQIWSFLISVRMLISRIESLRRRWRALPFGRERRNISMTC